MTKYQTSFSGAASNMKMPSFLESIISFRVIFSHFVLNEVVYVAFPLKEAEEGFQNTFSSSLKNSDDKNLS